MGTVVQQSLVLSISPEILGPESEYESRRSALVLEYVRICGEAAKMTAITSPEEAEIATQLGKLLMNGMREADVFFTPLKRQVDNFKGVILEHERRFIGDLSTQKRHLGDMLTAWNARCEAERQERERLAREEAEAKAREEMLARAIELESQGHGLAAEEILDAPVFVPVVAQAVAPPKTKGQITKTSYEAVVVDFKALVKAVADGRAPIQALQPDQSFLDSQAKAFKEGFSMPGCKLEVSTSTFFRS